MTDFATTDDTTTPSSLDGVAQFYVVPWTLTTVNNGSVETVLVECRYFDDRWNRVDHKPMNSELSFFQLTQRATTQKGEKPPKELDLTLMSAVAKTLDRPCNLTNSFIATGKPRATSLILPVLPGTKRGVILVFRSPAAGDTVDWLVATADPEIKNGSNSAD
jgi:hypothetical protein